MKLRHIPNILTAFRFLLVPPVVVLMLKDEFMPALVLFGIAIEILQGLTGYRYLESMDMLANSLGVTIGVLVRLTPVPVWFRQLERRLF